MARMVCSCGKLLSNGQSPNDIELWVYTDREWDEMFSGIDNIEPYRIPLPRREVWRCPKCESIYVFEHGKDKASVVYRPEKKQGQEVSE